MYYAFGASPHTLLKSTLADQQIILQNLLGCMEDGWMTVKMNHWPGRVWSVVASAQLLWHFIFKWRRYIAKFAVSSTQRQQQQQHKYQRSQMTSDCMFSNGMYLFIYSVYFLSSQSLSFGSAALSVCTSRQSVLFFLKKKKKFGPFMTHIIRIYI